MKNKIIGITELVEKVKKYFPEINKNQLKEVIEKFLAEIKSGLINDENISFKGYFSLYRGRTEPKESKQCKEHEKAVRDYSQKHKGKGIAAYGSSTAWTELRNKIKGCKSCKTKKQQIEKLSKPTDRINFKPSSKLLETSKLIKRKR